MAEMSSIAGPDTQNVLLVATLVRIHWTTTALALKSDTVAVLPRERYYRGNGAEIRGNRGNGDKRK